MQMQVALQKTTAADFVQKNAICGWLKITQMSTEISAE
jgi:hypothetical protein